MKSETGGAGRATGTEDPAENSQLKNALSSPPLPSPTHPQKLEEKGVSLASVETTIIHSFVCSFIHSFGIFQVSHSVGSAPVTCVHFIFSVLEKLAAFRWTHPEYKVERVT